MKKRGLNPHKIRKGNYVKVVHSNESKPTKVLSVKDGRAILENHTLDFKKWPISLLEKVKIKGNNNGRSSPFI